MQWQKNLYHFLFEVYVIIQDSISWSTFHSVKLPTSETISGRTIISPISQLN